MPFDRRLARPQDHMDDVAKFFDKGLKESLKDFDFKRTLENIEIIYSDTPDISILGAAALYYSTHK